MPPKGWSRPEPLGWTRLDVATDREAAETGRNHDGEYRECKGKLKPEDFIPCTLCGLRGHEPLDPDRCYQQISVKLGEWQP